MEYFTSNLPGCGFVVVERVKGNVLEALTQGSGPKKTLMLDQAQTNASAKKPQSGEKQRKTGKNITSKKALVSFPEHIDRGKTQHNEAYLPPFQPNKKQN
ncbi:hypothetical protein HRR83_006159 [Exophiala dermatitidis]|uniref:Uncharacterized protein n=1 Tax=Exophiala dermatitidis TaxID=5970 RepID=A0AAN6ISC8_EXODE|nr:hypothetical protein HRR74_005555 [Exophiala dermatitidis]KAJ4517582.1 hypothetical protein HRR73_004634 [Exophiala dermatitidis]KAJ4548658.1 hypothetical protein HRR76_001247 [Exophiala dermatitidis]KAJ4552622.1 hypothetical protein HRR77_002623 [Exophiala dermatitidis]KAJ4567123.1 hypothetical protein HRR81_007199 [Exophiala dermatitidis]